MKARLPVGRLASSRVSFRSGLQQAPLGMARVCKGTSDTWMSEVPCATVDSVGSDVHNRAADCEQRGDVHPCGRASDDAGRGLGPGPDPVAGDLAAGRP